MFWSVVGPAFVRFDPGSERSLGRHKTRALREHAKLRLCVGPASSAQDAAEGGATMRQIAGVAEEDVVQVGPGHDRVDLKGRRSRTQSGRALEVAAIAWIGARSPQAKGRVERLWGHGPGPAPQRAAPGRCPHHRWGQRGADGLPAATRRPLRRAAGQCRVGVAVTACWSTARDGLLLPPSAQRGTRRDVHPSAVAS